MTKVVLFMLDGVRPDAIVAANAPTLSALMSRGAYTMSAQSVMPSITLPCHTSIFHSVPPSRHGITSNVWTPLARPLPGLVDLAKQQLGLRSAFFINWEELRDVSRPGSLSYSWYMDASYLEHGDDLVAEQAARVIPSEQFDFAFVYFGTVDTFGHMFGWMSPEYLAQLERVDRQLGHVLDALPMDTAVVVHADHGGHERNHGTDTPEDMTIPWLAAGPTIRAGHVIQTPISLLDTAPTIAHILGLKASSQWEGRCVDEIFAS
jgi:predicted AlkP superfamily pyrophosphatase or phosphodiesterase